MSESSYLPVRVNQDQYVFQIDSNTEILVTANEQNRFSEGCENLRGSDQPKRQNLPLRRYDVPNKS